METPVIPPVLCVGEILWDALPGGLFPGGAPFNVACHLHQLGIPVLFASRTGNDRLGRTLHKWMTCHGLATNLLQTDPKLETGFVEVEMTDLEAPKYDIVMPAAWDALECTEPLQQAAAAASAIVFGSLALRSAMTRTTILGLLAGPAIKAFDINLRPPHIDRSAIEASLTAASMLKMNADEFELLTAWFELHGDTPTRLKGLSHRFELDGLIITRGGDGCCGLWAGEYVDLPGTPTRVIDPVGAGDAFLAGFLAMHLRQHPFSVCLTSAAMLGAYVVGQQGATSQLPPEVRDQFA